MVEPKELKSFASICKRMPKKGGGLGVSRTYMYRLINEGKIDLKSVDIDGTPHYIIPLADQKKEDWGLGGRLKKDKENDSK